MSNKVNQESPCMNGTQSTSQSPQGTENREGTQMLVDTSVEQKGRDWCIREASYLDCESPPAEQQAAPKAAPAPLSDDVVKDAARWRMAVMIGNEVMLHPEDRTQEAAVKAYMDATRSGATLTGAVDAAIAAQGGK